MNGPVTFQEAKVKLEAYCAYQERCTSELNNKMKLWGLSEEDRLALLLDLKEKNFLSEERFAESYVSGKVKIKKWGRLKILAGLREKKVPESIIQQAVLDIEEEEYIKNISRLAELKLEGLKGEKDDFRRKQKLFRYLQGKGYTFDEINEVYAALK